MLALLAVALVAVVATLHLRRPDVVFPVDDAYITLHNAVALRDGHDANYVGSAALTGATSAVHVVLIALASFVLSPERAQWAVGFAGAAAYLVGLVALCRRLGATPLTATGLVLLATIVGRSAHHLTNGLETSLAMAGTAWALALLVTPGPPKPGPLHVLLGTLPFVRPELTALVLLVLGVQASRLERAALLAAAPRALGLVALGAVPWMLVLLASTGAPLPNTVNAKKYFFAEGCVPALLKARWTALNLHLFGEKVGIFLVAATFLLLTREGLATLAFFVVFVGAYFANLPGGLSHYEGRYLYVFLPVLAFGAASGDVHGARWVRVAARVLVGLALVESARNLPERAQERENFERFARVELGGVATWANEHLPREAKVLVHDAGYLSWATPFQLVDLVGLKTPASVPPHRELTWGTCVAYRPAPGTPDLFEQVNDGRARAVERILEHEAPSHLVVLRHWNTIYQLVPRLSARGWRFGTLRENAWGYEVFTVTPPAPPSAPPPVPGPTPASEPRP